MCICSARGGEFCFFPFPRLGCSGHQGLTLANPDEVCCFCLYDITPTWRLQLLLKEIRFCFFGIDWDLKPEINIHTLHRTEHLVAIYFKDRVSFFLPEWGEWGEVKGSVREVLVMKTKN